MTTLIQIAPWRNQEIYRYFEYLMNGPLAGIDCVIAGGSVRSLYLKEKLGSSDIDVWFKSEEDLKEANTRIKEIEQCNPYFRPECTWAPAKVKSFVQVSDTEYGQTYKVIFGENSILPSSTAVQLLRKRTAIPGIAGVIDLFDFTICQFAYKNGMIYASQAAISDHKAKILRFNSKNTLPVCHDRAIKYMGKGYSPTPKLFEKMFLENVQTMTPGSIELTNLFYEDAFKKVI